MSIETEKVYWSGVYAVLQRLSRSPRFNRPQSALSPADRWELNLIMDETARIREKAEACGAEVPR